LLLEIQCVINCFSISSQVVVFQTSEDYKNSTFVSDLRLEQKKAIQNK